jgi:hypothetical protein
VTEPDDAEIAFRQACELRDQRALLEAKAKFEEALALARPDDNKLRSATNSQLAFVEDLRADEAPNAEDRRTHQHAVAAYAAKAVELNPRAELPSLQLYIVLVHLGRIPEALREAIRFLRLRDSVEYRAMLTPRHAEDKDPAIAALAQTARDLLAGHAKDP